MSVKVGSLSGVREAVSQGAKRVYLAPESFRGKENLRAAVELTLGMGAEAVICLPRILRDRECGEWEGHLQSLSEMGAQAFLVPNLGALQLVRQYTDLPIYADFSFNLLNSRAVALLARRGASQATLSLEASFQDLELLARSATLPLEALVHGPLPGMILEHCLTGIFLASVEPASCRPDRLEACPTTDPCPAPCRGGHYGLKDELGQVRAIESDGRCSSQIYLSRELACLFHLNRFQGPALASLRIEAQYYPAELVRIVTRLYRRALAGEEIGSSAADWKNLCDAVPQGFTLGAYRHHKSEFRSIDEVSVSR